MGARGHIGIVQTTSETPIYFYTHWQGYDIARLLAEGLYKALDNGRLEDETYATRIIFDTLTGCTGEATGYGIMIGEPAGDNEYPIPTVFFQEMTEPFIVYEDKRYSARDFITSHAEWRASQMT